jgi:hypothetical protein
VGAVEHGGQSDLVTRFKEFARPFVGALLSAVDGFEAHRDRHKSYADPLVEELSKASAEEREGLRDYVHGVPTPHD